MAKITINFIGQWRLYVGQRAIKLEADSINEVKLYIEDHIGPGFREKLQSKGVKEKHSICDNSHILLNGKKIQNIDEPVLKDGDIVELLPRMTGG